MHPTIILLLSAFNTSSFSLYVAFSVDEEVLKRNVQQLKYYWSQYVLIVCHIILSKTLENEISKEICL